MYVHFIFIDLVHNHIITRQKQQEFLLGQQLRSLYINSSSPSYIQGISTGLYNQSQVNVIADFGDEGNVVYDAAVSFTQGMWPATTNYNITLANGTFVIGPLGGYQVSILYSYSRK